jgi:hypothetical protein
MRTSEQELKSWRHWLETARKWDGLDDCKATEAYAAAIAAWSDWCEALKREGKEVPAGTSPYSPPPMV